MPEKAASDAKRKRRQSGTRGGAVNEHYPPVIPLWIVREAGRLLRAAAFFRAAGTMCQIPGGMELDFIYYDENRDMPALREHPEKWALRKSERERAFDVLAEALRRLGVQHLIKQVPAASGRRPRALSRDLAKWLDRQARPKHGLLNVVTMCLDALIVQPADELAGTLPGLWRRWWGQEKRGGAEVNSAGRRRAEEKRTCK
jgi:hypothetical protein